ncbi:chromosome partitioning protein ParB [Rubrivivax gelatinosus]|nr:chromosome partitioning protein ParB [Rubrivivax gelatinosus]
MLNFGSRRLRASALAGRRTVPAFVDLSTDSYDQIIENEQRQNLQPLELALFVQRRMRAGDTAAEISRRLGKSRSYITFIGALIDAPDSVMDLYRSGRCRGITELYEVRRLRECDPRAVDEWLSTAAEVTRTELQRLKESLAACGTAEDCMPLRVQHPTPSSEPDARAVTPLSRVASESVPELLQSPLEQHTAAQHAQSPRPKLLLLAQYRDEEVVVDLEVVPVQVGHVFVRQREQSQVIPVDVTFLSQLRIVRALS